MRKFTRGLLFSLLLTVPSWGEEVRLFLLHTNDIHGHLEAAKEPVVSGGYVRVATVIRAFKAAFPDRVVVLDAGDLALGTPTSGLFFGLPTAEAMKSVGYDAVAIGNHEFNWGQEAMARLLQAIGATILCSNLVSAADGSHPYAPSTVIEKGGARIGVIGLVAPDTATRTPEAYTRGWLFQQSEPAAQQALAALPEVDAVIALTHIGLDGDKKLAQSVPGLDLIVGGHSHTALREIVTENGVPIVQSGCYCQFLGVMEIVIDTEADSLKVATYHLVPIDDSIAPDPQVSAIVEGYAAKVRPILDRVVGQVSQTVTNKPGKQTVDTPLGCLIADTLRAESAADFALYNRGGVRGDLPSGSLSIRKLHEMFPFDDAVVVLRASGSEIQAVLEEGSETRAQLSPSGLRVVLDKQGKAKVTRDGVPLEADKTYTLATTNFLATGGDGMSTLARLKVVKTLPFTREVVASYLDKNPGLTPPNSGRATRLP